MNDNLTDSQRRLLAAMRREMVDVTAPVLAEIEKLRQEQKRLHEDGLKRQDDFFARIRQDIRRHAFGLLGLVGVGEDEVKEWDKKRK